MKRVLGFLLVTLICLGSIGCMFYDVDHSRTHFEQFERDIEEAHYDLDWLFYSVNTEGPPERKWAGYY